MAYSLDLSEEFRQRIDQRAAELNIATSAFIKMAVAEKLEEANR